MCLPLLLPLPQGADLILWVGISFEQSASVEYFRRVRHMLGLSGRLDVKQVRHSTFAACSVPINQMCC